MKHLRALSGLFLLLALLALAAMLRGGLPTDRQALIEKKYSGWSGVLRLWSCEAWPTGSGGASPWLNRCITAFERAHPGVYIQCDSVEAETLARWRDGTMIPPDLLLFPPGAMATPAGLAPLSGGEALRGDLARRGDWLGICYALPAAMGGYALLENSAVNGGTAVPAPESFRHWRVALAALASTGTADGANDTGAAPEPPGIDLGLPAVATPGAWQRFAKGEAGALLASQREIVRLAALTEAGRGPEWRIADISPFTDQLLFVAVPCSGEPERQALSEAFAGALLSEESQGCLARAGLFAVTHASAGYGSGDALAPMEAFLRARTLLAPRAFGMAWIDAAEALVQASETQNPNDFVNTLGYLLE